MTMKQVLVAVIVAVVLSCISARYVGDDRLMRYQTAGEPEQDWAYVEVRPAAHMFYWLYRTTAAGGATNAPLVMWLQGGPGGSSTGFGNFEEIGPLDTDENPRNTTWLQAASLLFVDNPVGTGFSYVDEDSAYTTDVHMIAEDLLTMFKDFLSKSKEFQNVPFYIFCESYGGKMAAAFAQVLQNAIEQHSVTCNFKGVALGDSWISPIDSTLSWGPYLYVNSLVDATGLAAINDTAQKAARAVRRGDWHIATDLWGETESVVESHTNNVNFYNILDYGQPEPGTKKAGHRTPIDRVFDKMVRPYQSMSLAQYMNGPVRDKLKIIPKNVTWGGQAGEVFRKQAGDFMKPVTDIVDYLIEKTPLKVVIYSGQLDLIVDIIGTEAWVYNLTIAAKFRKSERIPLMISTITNGFVKTADNFSLYWILKAGHMVPADNGPAALEMVKQILKQK